MKRFAALFAAVALFAQGEALAHEGAHGPIGQESALYIANKAVQKLTFKDLGYEVGKLDAGWKALGQDQLTVIDTKPDFYIIAAKHPETGELIYLQIANNGGVMAVSNNNAF